MKIHVTVNGVAYDRDVEPRTLLAYFLREECRLTGTHVGCDTSSCGCCVVVLDGTRAVKSCAMFAAQADGHEVLTVEGLAAEQEHAGGRNCPDRDLIAGRENQQPSRLEGLPGDLDVSFKEVNRTLFVLVRDQKRLSRLAHRIAIEQLGESFHRRGLAEQRTGDDADGFSFAFDLRQRLGGVMREVRGRFLVLLGQRHPDLYAVEFLPPLSEFDIGAFGVNDAAPRGHPVDLAGLDGLHGAKTVSMNDRPGEQIGHRGQTDMRMGPHVDARAGW